MRTIMILYILLTSLRFFCQTDQLDNRLCVKIAPLALLDIYSGSSPRMGLEYKLQNNIALYNEIGTYLPNANGMHNNRGYLAKIELKKYLNQKNLSSGKYISAELFYKQQSYSTADTLRGYYTNYSVDKNVTCITIKYGMLTVHKSKLVIDIFGGIGIRYKNVSSSLTSEENGAIVPDGDNNVNVYLNKTGNYAVPNFDAGIKIGYRLK